MTALKYPLLAILLASAVYMAVAAPPRDIIPEPGSADRKCHTYEGDQGMGTSILNVVGDLFPNSYTDGVDDGVRVVYDKEHNEISITTGKNSLPENLVSVTFKSPSANSLNAPAVYRLLKDDYCSVKLDQTPPADSVLTIYKGPVPPPPRVHGGICAPYIGDTDPAAKDLIHEEGVFWTDQNKNQQGTALKFNEADYNITIVTGNEAKDYSLVEFKVEAVYIDEPGTYSSSSASTGFRIRSRDSCTAIVPNLNKGIKTLRTTFSATLGTPLPTY